MATDVDTPRLLFLSQTLPFPPDGGVKIRTFHTLRCLAKTFDLTALCFFRSKPGALDPKVTEAVRGLSKFGEVEAFPIPQEHDRIRKVWDHLRSILSRRVYTVFTYESDDFLRSLQGELASGSYDLVHLDSLDLSGYLPLIRDVPTVCVHHDAQSRLLRRRADHVESRAAATYMRMQARLMQREERRVCPSVDLNVAVSEVDRDVLTELAPGSQFEVLPNGVDIDYFQPVAQSTDGLVFVGGTTWYPNKDALSYFARDVLPAIRRRCPDIATTWVGRAHESEIVEYSAAPGLQLTGYVEDIRPYVASAACYVVPLRIGGGTRIKILDAWAMEKAVVSTSVGCEGLDARHGENILIADSPDAFAEQVQRVVEDPSLRSSLGQEARRTVERSYGWDAIGDQMNATYLRLIER